MNGKTHSGEKVETEILKKDELYLVKPKFRKMVEDTWNKGENVPYGVVYLSDAEPTKEDAERVDTLIKEGKISE